MSPPVPDPDEIRNELREIYDPEIPVNIVDLGLIYEIEQEDTHRAVWKALRQLPSEQAEVVVLWIWEELSFAEIGVRMGRSAESARKLWSRAVDKLQVELERVANGQ